MNYMPLNKHSFRPPNSHKSAIRCPDLIAMVGYHDKAMVLSPLTSAFDEGFSRSVNHLPSVVGGSGTNFKDALREAIDLLVKTPSGLRRRIWLLSDGMDNMHSLSVPDEVARAAQNRININTVGFCLAGTYGPKRLEAIAFGTRAGRYITADTIEQLGHALKRAAGSAPSKPHQGEATVFCIDLSPSMRERIEVQTAKIEAVRDAMFNLIRYKQQMWS